MVGAEEEKACHDFCDTTRNAYLSIRTVSMSVPAAKWVSALNSKPTTIFRSLSSSFATTRPSYWSPNMATSIWAPVLYLVIVVGGLGVFSSLYRKRRARTCH